MLALRRLYDWAGKPQVRKISDWILENDDLPSTLSRDFVSRTLRGDVGRWPNLESLVHVLVEHQVVGESDLKTVLIQIHELWVLASASPPPPPKQDPRPEPQVRPLPNPAPGVAAEVSSDERELLNASTTEPLIAPGARLGKDDDQDFSPTAPARPQEPDGTNKGPLADAGPVSDQAVSPGPDPVARPPEARLPPTSSPKPEPPGVEPEAQPARPPTTVPTRPTWSGSPKQEPSQPSPPAGWYRDPTGQADMLRWWNGTQWTNKTEKDAGDEGEGDHLDEEFEAFADVRRHPADGISSSAAAGSEVDPVRRPAAETFEGSRRDRPWPGALSTLKPAPPTLVETIETIRRGSGSSRNSGTSSGLLPAQRLEPEPQPVPKLRPEPPVNEDSAEAMTAARRAAASVFRAVPARTAALFAALQVDQAYSAARSIQLASTVQASLDSSDHSDARRTREAAVSAAEVWTSDAYRSPEFVEIRWPTSREQTQLRVTQRLYEEAARGGQTDAALMLGFLLQDLDPPDIGEAWQWWVRAAQAGDVNSMFFLGLLHCGQDPPQTSSAERWWSAAADTGHKGALLELANLQRNAKRAKASGSGDQHNGATARVVHHKLKAVPAATRVKYGLALQRLSPPDLDGARVQFSAAAEMGAIEGMTLLGDLLTQKVEPADWETADYWYARAVDLGSRYGGPYRPLVKAAPMKKRSVGEAVRRWLQPPL
jgi:hypothetical protein